MLAEMYTSGSSCTLFLEHSACLGDGFNKSQAQALLSQLMESFELLGALVGLIRDFERTSRSHTTVIIEVESIFAEPRQSFVNGVTLHINSTYQVIVRPQLRGTRRIQRLLGHDATAQKRYKKVE